MVNTRPMAFTNMNLPVYLIERIKAAARMRAVMECRHVPYVELVREALERCFPDSSETPQP